MEITNSTIINGLTLAEHRELGRAILAVMEAIDKMEQCGGSGKAALRIMGEQVDALLDGLADLLADSWPDKENGPQPDIYPYPLFRVDRGRILAIAPTCDGEAAPEKERVSRELFEADRLDWGLSD